MIAGPTVGSGPRRDALHAGDASLGRDNLAAGVDAYAVRAKLIDRNPFA